MNAATDRLQVALATDPGSTRTAPKALADACLASLPVTAVTCSWFQDGLPIPLAGAGAGAGTCAFVAEQIETSLGCGPN